MKRTLSLILCSTLVVSALTGCSSTTSTDSSSSDSKVQDITFATWAGPEELNEMQALTDQVNASTGQANGYKITLMDIPSADYYTKIQAMFAAKSSDVDLMWLSQEYIPSYAPLGGLQDITDSVNSDQQVQFSNMYDGAQKAATYDSKIYGVPWTMNPVIMYYNKNLTDAAGYTQTDYDNWASGNWTTDDFMSVAQSISKDTNGDGKLDQWGTYIWDWPPLQEWLWAFGGGYIDDNNNVTVNSSESMQGWQYIVDLMSSGASALPSTGASNSGMTTLFQTGTIGMILAGASDGIEKDNLPFDIGYGMIPKGPNGDVQSFPYIGLTCENVFSDVDSTTLYQALSDMTAQFYQWKVPSPVKGMEDVYQTTMPLKANLPVDVVKNSLSIADAGNLTDYAEIGNAVSVGTDGTNGIQTQIYNATVQSDPIAALKALDLQSAADTTADAIQAVLDGQ